MLFEYSIYDTNRSKYLPFDSDSLRFSEPVLLSRSVNLLGLPPSRKSGVSASDMGDGTIENSRSGGGTETGVKNRHRRG